MIKVLFFASLRDSLNCSELQVNASDNSNVEQLLQNLQARDNNWLRALSSPNLMVAVNQTMASKSVLLKEGDEIAFFPPVTGG